MKKYLIILLSIIMVLSLTGCSTTTMEEVELESLKAEIQELESYKASLEEQISTIKEENDIHSYIIELTVSQSHFTLDIGTHIKDAMNELTFEIPVSEEFYNSVKVGDVLEEDFRTASLVLKGSFGSWEVKVTNKEIR